MTVSEQRQVKCEFCENGQCPITIEMAIDAGDRSMAGGTTTCGNCGGDGWVARAEPSRGAPDAAHKFGANNICEGCGHSLGWIQEKRMDVCDRDLRNWLLEQQRQELIKLKSGHVVLLEALRRLTEDFFPKACTHGGEPWYCDGCRYAWEKELAARQAEAKSLVEGQQ